MDILHDSNVPSFIIEHLKWIQKQATTINPTLTTEDDQWVDLQVKFRFGKAYDLILNKKWVELYPIIQPDQKINRWLTPLDKSYALVKKAYNDWGEYRFNEAAAQVMVYNMLSDNKASNILLPIIMVDTMGPSKFSYWAYNRKVGTGQHILWPLCSHWAEFMKGLNDTTVWADKQHKLIFRGVTTGPLVSTIHNDKIKSSHTEIINQWAHKPWADLGFNKIIDSTKNDPKWSQFKDKVLSLQKPSLKIEVMLKSRFILCIEGNDVSTSFGWVLASHCVPIHPYPFIYEVWYFQNLQPWVHFIPCKPDGSDIEEQVEWAQSHDPECQKIAQQGRSYMAKMIDPILFVEVLKRMYQMWNLRTDNNKTFFMSLLYLYLKKKTIRKTQKQIKS